MSKKETFKTTAIAMVLFLALFAVAAFAGCGNKDYIDTVRTYDKAIIQLANGDVVETKIKAWRDYDGEQLQVTAEDGTVYLTSSFRCDLINSKEE